MLIYRGPHCPSLARGTRHHTWAWSQAGSRRCSSELPTQEQQRRKRELDQRARRVYARRLRIQTEIEKQISSSPLFKITFEKRKRKTGRDKRYIDLHPCGVPGWKKPHVRLECFESSDLQEHGTHTPIDSSVFTSQVFSTSEFKKYLGYNDQDFNRDVFKTCYPTANVDGPGTRSQGTYVAPLRALLQKTYSFVTSTSGTDLSKRNQKKQADRSTSRVAMQQHFSEIHLAALRLPKEKGCTHTPPRHTHLLQGM
jgi:hypothetical protein